MKTWGEGKEDHGHSQQIKLNNFNISLWDKRKEILYPISIATKALRVIFSINPPFTIVYNLVQFKLYLDPVASSTAILDPGYIITSLANSLCTRLSFPFSNYKVYQRSLYLIQNIKSMHPSWLCLINNHKKDQHSYYFPDKSSYWCYFSSWRVYKKVYLSRF